MPSIPEVRAAREHLNRACEANGRDPATLRLAAFLAICVAPSEREVEQIIAAYQATNPQYVRMLDSRDRWIIGTPAQAREQLAALAEAGIDRALLSVNCDLHLPMLPQLVG